FSAQGRRGHGDRYAGIEIGTVALEQVVWADRDEDVEIARWSAAQPCLALVGQAAARAVLDALGNVDAELAVFLAPALATAIGAGLVHHLPTALADRAGALDGEETLRRAHLAMPVALAAGMGAGARLGARAVAGGATHQGRHIDLYGAALEALFEADFEVVAQIAAAQLGGAA